MCPVPLCCALLNRGTAAPRCLSWCGCRGQALVAFCRLSHHIKAHCRSGQLPKQVYDPWPYSPGRFQPPIHTGWLPPPWNRHCVHLGALTQAVLPCPCSRDSISTPMASPRARWRRVHPINIYGRHAHPQLCRAGAEPGWAQHTRLCLGSRQKLLRAPVLPAQPLTLCTHGFSALQHRQGPCRQQ